MLSTKDTVKIAGLTPFVSEQSLPQFMNWRCLETLLNNRPMLTTARVYPTNDLPPISIAKPSWCTDELTWPVSLLSELVSKQQTFYLKDLSRLTKETNAFCAELEEIFRQPVDMHLFCCLVPGDEGLGKHADGNHNIIAPQEGHVKVTLYDDDKVTHESVIRPRDFVFIPAGVYHKVESEQKRFSLSFPIAVNDGVFEDRAWISLGG